MTPSLDLEALRQQAREARERAQKATPGPWEVESHSDRLSAPPRIRVSIPLGGVTYLAWFYGETNPVDPVFIASARADVPTLASSVLTLADEVERLREQISDIHAYQERVRTEPAPSWADETGRQA